MNPIIRITKAQAMRLVGCSDYRTFDKYVQKLGITLYPGLGSTPMFSEEDVIKKWNKPLTELKREVLK